MVVVGQVAAEGAQDDHEHEQEGECLHEFGENSQTETDFEGPESQKSEELQVALNQQVQQDEAEGIGPQVLADLVVEEAEEEPVEQEAREKSQGDGEEEEVQDVVEEEVVVPRLLHVPDVGVDIVLGDVLQLVLEFVQVRLQADDFPLLFLNEGNGLEDIMHNAPILLLMILVEPEIINHHEQELVSSHLQHIQQRPDVFDDREDLALHHAFPFFIFGVELGAFDAIVFRLIAGPACLVTINLADPFRRLILDAQGRRR